MKWLGSCGIFFLYYMIVSADHQSQECRLDRTHTFKVEADVQFSFSAKIESHGGLVMDINYGNGPKDRIRMSSKNCTKSMYNGNDYDTTLLSTQMDEGWNDVDVAVSNNNLQIILKSSQMSTLDIKIKSGIKSITVSSGNLKICEERCKVEKSIEKTIEHEERFKITAFSTSNSPIIFKISTDEGDIGHLEMKPGDCTFTWMQKIQIISCGHVNPGWNTFDIFVNKTTLAIYDNIIINTIPVNDSLKSISISGKYLVNCTKGTPKWKITNEIEIPIPITFDQDIGFTLTSNVPFYPVFNLYGMKVTLNWNNGLKIGSLGRPLKPKSYYIIVETRSDMLILYHKEKSDVLMELKIEKVPEFITVSSLQGEYQIALSLHDSMSQSADVHSGINVPQALESYWESSPVNTNVIITASLVSVLVPVVIAIIVILAWKKLKKKKKISLSQNKLVDSNSC